MPLDLPPGVSGAIDTWIEAAEAQVVAEMDATWWPEEELDADHVMRLVIGTVEHRGERLHVELEADLYHAAGFSAGIPCSLEIDEGSHPPRVVAYTIHAGPC